MNRNVRKSNDCISVGKEEKLIRINSLTLVQFPSTIDIGMNPQLWSWRETLDWKSQVLDLLLGFLLVSGKKHNQDLTCKKKGLVLSENKDTRKKAQSLGSEIGNVSSFPSLTLYDSFPTLLLYLLKQFGSYPHTLIFRCTLNTLRVWLSERGPEAIGWSQKEKQ